jgi:hypothetical protein
MGSLREFGMVQFPWRPDLRRDIVGVPDISGPQKRKREMWSTQRECLHHGGSQSLVGNPVPRDESELRPSTRIFEKMREQLQLCMRGGLTEGERTLRDDWLVVDGSWRCTGVEELPCELVREWRFLGLGVPQSSSDPGGREWELRDREQDGVEEAGRARSVPESIPI